MQRWGKVRYWREGDYEVDFVVTSGQQVTAIEVKSSRQRETLSGLVRFDKRFSPDRQLLIGADGVELESFLSQPVGHWVKIKYQGN